LYDPASFAYLVWKSAEELSTARTYEVFTATRTYTLTVVPAGPDAIEMLGRTWPARKLNLTLRRGELLGSARTPKRLRREPKGELVQEATLWIASGAERVPLRMEGRTFWGWVAIELSGRDGDGAEQR
jgi:hypothetical protein